MVKMGEMAEWGAAIVSVPGTLTRCNHLAFLALQHGRSFRSRAGRSWLPPFGTSVAGGCAPSVTHSAPVWCNTPSCVRLRRLRQTGAGMNGETGVPGTMPMR